jgi:RHS repeat-associated protein
MYDDCSGHMLSADKFTGKERDAESGLDDFEARYYSSQFGRFHSADWSAIPVPVPYADLGNPQTLNLYAYVKNNPLNLTDPTGHLASTIPGPTSSQLGDQIAGLQLDSAGGNFGDGGADSFSSVTGEINSALLISFFSDGSVQLIPMTPSQLSSLFSATAQETNQQNSDVVRAAAIGATGGAVGGAIIGGVIGGVSGATAGTAVEPGGGTVVLGIVGAGAGAQKGAEIGAAAGAAAGALGAVVYTQSKEATKAVANLINTAIDHLGKLNGPDQNPNPHRGWRDTVRKSADNISKQADKIANKHLANAARFTADLLRALVD